jgi:CCR4-NOT transcription complex subunit 4
MCIFLFLQAINFCQCGYKMCLWCWNQLMETASREALPGRCPNCRTEVGSALLSAVHQPLVMH